MKWTLIMKRKNGSSEMRREHLDVFEATLLMQGANEALAMVPDESILIGIVPDGFTFAEDK